MYVGKRYTATVDQDFELPYRCKHCGFKSDTTVFSFGSGQGHSPYFLDAQGARERAGAKAASDARNNAWTALRLCPCPKCKMRDAAGFIVRSTLLIVVTAGPLWAFAWTVASVHTSEYDIIVWGLGIFGLVIVLVVGFVALREWTTAEDRVIFHAIDGKPLPAARDDEAERDDEEASQEGAGDDGEEVRRPGAQPRRHRGRRRTR